MPAQVGSVVAPSASLSSLAPMAIRSTDCRQRFFAWFSPSDGLILSIVMTFHPLSAANVFASSTKLW